MHMPAAVAAWAEWVVWTCNYRQLAGCSQKRADFKSALFFRWFFRVTPARLIRASLPTKV